MQKVPSKESKNWLIFMLYVRNEHEECLRLIEETIKESNNRNNIACYIIISCRCLSSVSQGQIAM